MHLVDEGVEHPDAVPALDQRVAEMGADEPGAACDEDPLHDRPVSGGAPVKRPRCLRWIYVNDNVRREGAWLSGSHGDREIRG